MNKAIYSFVLLALASMMWTHDLPMSWMGYYYTPCGSLVSLLLVLIAYIYGSKVKRQDIEAVMPWVGVVLAAGAIADKLHLNPMGNMLQNGRPGSFQGGPIFLGASLAICLPFCLGVKEKSWRIFFVSMTCLGLCVSMAKGGILAAIIGGTIYVKSKQH